MDLENIVQNKSLKTKEKVTELSNLLILKTLNIDELVQFAATQKDANKGTCIEAIEFATKQNQTIATQLCFEFVISALTDKAPRVKWEAAKVIANIAHLFPKQLSPAIVNLLHNAEHTGTVVRWAAAFALSEIIKLKTPHNKTLISAVENLLKLEQNNGVKNKYKDALQKNK